MAHIMALYFCYAANEPAQSNSSQNILLIEKPYFQHKLDWSVTPTQGRYAHAKLSMLYSTCESNYILYIIIYLVIISVTVISY